MEGSCVVSTTAAPVMSAASSSTSITRSLLARSSWLVGSSARISRGALTRARAIGDALRLAAGELVRDLPSDLGEADQRQELERRNVRRVLRLAHQLAAVARRSRSR